MNYEWIKIMTQFEMQYLIRESNNRQRIEECQARIAQYNAWQREDEEKQERTIQAGLFMEQEQKRTLDYFLNKNKQ